jgi:hypothetical protein
MTQGEVNISYRYQGEVHISYRYPDDDRSPIITCRKCGSICLDWNDLIALAEKHELEWIAETGLMYRRPILLFKGTSISLIKESQ